VSDHHNAGDETPDSPQRIVPPDPPELPAATSGDEPQENAQPILPPDPPAAPEAGESLAADESTPYANLFGPGDEPEVRAAPPRDEEEDAGEALDEELDDEEEDEEPAPRRARPVLIIVGAVVLLAVGGVLGLLATQWSAAGGSDQAIARVGEVTISRGEFLRRYDGGQDPQALLDELIDIELVVQASRREGSVADTAEIEQRVEQLREQQGGSAEAFNQFLQQNNIPSEEALRGLLERDQLIQAMVLKHTTLEQARARHILLAGDSPESIEQRKSEAEELFEQLEGGADFMQLAGEKSEDPGSKAQGGDLGWAPRGVFVPAFDAAIFSMQPGELRLVQSEFGWHIIQLQDAPQVRPLDDQRYFQTPVVQEAINTTFLPWVKALRSEAEQQGHISVLVQPTDLVPPAAPAGTAAP
jgi:peptidyl-prolyl cis-trans isomerase C